MAEKKRGVPEHRSYVGPLVKMDGTLRFDGTMHLDGKYNGNIESREGSLVVGESGEITANIRAGDIQNFGHIKGDIAATERVCFKSSSQVEGNVETKKLHIEDGAEFLGNCRMGISPREKKKKEQLRSIQHAHDAAEGSHNSLFSPVVKVILLLVVVSGSFFAYSSFGGKTNPLLSFQKKSKEELLHEGNLSLAEDNLTKAKVSFNAVLKEDRKNIPARKALIDIAIREKKYHVADAALLDLIAEEKEDEGLYDKLIELREKQGDISLLLEAYKIKSNAFAKDKEVRRKYAELLEKSGDIKGAVHVYEEIVALTPSDIPSLKKIAKYYQEEKEYFKAIEVLRRITQFDDRHIENFLTLGRFYNIVGLEDKANAAYQRVEELNPDNIEAKNNEGFRLYQEMHYAKSRRVFRHVVGVDANNFRAHLGLATNYMKVGSFSRAVAECKRALELEPESAIALNRMAWSLAQLNKDLNKAMEYSQKALAINKDVPGHIDTASEIYYRMKQYEKAVETSKRAVQLAPDNLYYKSQLEKFEAALRKSKKAT